MTKVRSLFRKTSSKSKKIEKIRNDVVFTKKSEAISEKTANLQSPQFFKISCDRRKSDAEIQRFSGYVNNGLKNWLTRIFFEKPDSLQEYSSRGGLRINNCQMFLSPP